MARVLLEHRGERLVLERLRREIVKAGGGALAARVELFVGRQRDDGHLQQRGSREEVSRSAIGASTQFHGAIFLRTRRAPRTHSRVHSQVHALPREARLAMHARLVNATTTEPPPTAHTLVKRRGGTRVPAAVSHS